MNTDSCHVVVAVVIVVVVFFPVLLYPESETKRTKTVRQESVLQKGGGAQRSTTFQVNTDGSVMSRRSSVRFRFWNCVDVFFNIFFK